MRGATSVAGLRAVAFSPMSLLRRLGLVAVLAVALVGGLVPSGVASGLESTSMSTIQAIEASLPGPLSCADATCGKGTPAASVPVPVVALLGVVAAAILTLASRALRRRRQSPLVPLAAGVRDPQFHPPRFS